MRFEFGDVVVDRDTRQVFRDGAEVHLLPKAFDLLVTLIHERPRSLAKADLHARLWPKTFVSDASLTMLVAEVRAALGECARQPRYVRTVHRHGYAFQGHAREVLRDSDGPRTPPTDAPAAPDALLGYWVVTASRQIALAPGENLIGRDPKVRVWLDSPSVSRHHARICLAEDRATLEDLGSKNGTRARGASVTAITPLADGDQLRFGSVNASFRAWAADLTRSETGSP